MLRRLLILALAIVGGLVYIAPPVWAAQLAESSTVSLSGIVLPNRYIYLDGRGDIQKVIGNTSENLTPTVLNDNGQAVKPAAKTIGQYQRLLEENGGRLQAGQTYYLNKYNPYVLFARLVTTNPYFSQKII